MRVLLLAALLFLSGCATYPAGPSLYHNEVLMKHINYHNPSPGFEYRVPYYTGYARYYIYY